jgi:hypothetical protein
VHAADLSARGWTSQGARAVRAALVAGPSPDEPFRRARDLARDAKRREKAERALGETGLGAVALAGAAGVTEAHDLLVELLGSAGERAVAELRSDLGDRVLAQVALERTSVGGVLDDPDLAEDAASRLRLRLAVLKGLT